MSQKRVILSAFPGPSRVSAHETDRLPELSTHAATAFKMADYVGLTYDLHTVFERRPEITLDRLAVFAKPDGRDRALVLIEATVTLRGLNKLLKDAARHGIDLEPAEPRRAKDEFPERGWWRPQDWPGCGSLVTEFPADSAHAQAARLSGPAAAGVLFPWAAAVADPERFEFAYQPGTRYIDTEFAEVFYRSGFNILGWVSSPFHHQRPRRRLEVVFQHPSVLDCPLSSDQAPYGLVERLAVLGHTKQVDVLKVHDLTRPDDVG